MSTEPEQEDPAGSRFNPWFVLLPVPMTVALAMMATEGGSPLVVTLIAGCTGILIGLALVRLLLHRAGRANEKGSR